MPKLPIIPVNPTATPNPTKSIKSHVSGGTEVAAEYWKTLE